MKIEIIQEMLLKACHGDPKRAAFYARQMARDLLQNAGSHIGSEAHETVHDFALHLVAPSETGNGGSGD